MAGPTRPGYTGPAAGQESRYYDGYAMAHRGVKVEAHASSLKPLGSTEVFIGHDAMCAEHPNGNDSFRAPPSRTFLISDEQARKIPPFISSLNDGALGATTGYIHMRNSRGHAISAKLRIQVVTIIAIAASLQEMHTQHARNLQTHGPLTTTAPERQTKRKTKRKPTREPEVEPVTDVTYTKRKTERKPEREAEHEPERKPETEQQMRKRMQLESEEYARSRGVDVQEPFSYQKLTPVSVVAGSRRNQTKKQKKTSHAHCCIGGRCHQHAMHHAQATAQPEGENITAQPEGENTIAQATAQPEGENITAQPEAEDKGNFENEETLDKNYWLALLEYSSGSESDNDQAGSESDNDQA